MRSLRSPGRTAARTFTGAVLLGSLLLLSSCAQILSGDGEYRPKGIAIVYGVEDYETYNGSNYDLNLTRDDAEAMESLFLSHGFSVRPRYDAAATKEQLLLDIEWARTLLDSGGYDTLVFYFSGHGLTFDPLTDWSTTSVAPSSPSRSEIHVEYEDTGFEALALRGSLADLKSSSPTFSTSIRNDEIAVLFGGLAVEKKIVIIDACHSGGFVSNASEVDAVPGHYTGERVDGGTTGEVIERYFSYPELGTDFRNDIAVISAAGEWEVSWENSDYGHGIFTYYFLESATAGDLDSDGFITLTEAYNYTAAKIEEEWNRNYIERGLLYYTKDEKWPFFPHISGGPFDFVLFTTE